MRVRGQEVDPALLQQLVRHLLRAFALVSSQRVRRHLDQHAGAQPLHQPLGFVLQRGVALRMGEDRRQPGQAQIGRRSRSAPAEGRSPEPPPAGSPVR